MIHLSLNEIDASVKKAARGVGLKWGMAEEAGKSARWLAEHGILDMHAFVSVLTKQDTDTVWALESAVACLDNVDAARVICPLILGSWIADLGSDLNTLIASRAFRVFVPSLLVPFLSRLTSNCGFSLALEWPMCRVFCFDGSVAVEGDKQALLISEPVGIAILSAKATARSWSTESKSGVTLTEEHDWIKICEFGHRTYVPSSALSRQLGAGAGTNDND